MEYIDSKYFSYADPDDPYLKRLIIRTIESLSGQPELYKLYNEYQRSLSYIEISGKEALRS